MDAHWAYNNIFFQFLKLREYFLQWNESQKGRREM